MQANKIYKNLKQIKTLCICVMLALFLSTSFGRERESNFEALGDILALAPIGVLIASVGIKDYEGAVQLIAGSLVTQGSIELIKKGFNWAHNQGYDVSFAKRPCCDNYYGMPSGHAGGAFSAAGFVYYRYGWKWSLPLIGLGILTDASRVYAQKHTVWQVLAGSAIAWGWSYVFTTPYKPRKFLLTPKVSTNLTGENIYGINLSYAF